MKSSTKNIVEGKLHQAKGKLKEVVGSATNNPDLEVEGQGENLNGKIQEKIGHVEKVIEQ
jgi:uncharacterized protein YjbJ (UPF0337 family)